MPEKQRLVHKIESKVIYLMAKPVKYKIYTSPFKKYTVTNNSYIVEVQRTW